MRELFLAAALVATAALADPADARPGGDKYHPNGRAERQETATVSGDVKVKANRIGVLSPPKTVGTVTIVWHCDDEKVHIIDVEGKAYWTAPPGKYKILCFVSTPGPGKTSTDRHEAKVEVTGDEK